MDGALIVDKPPDFTSHDVVASARRILHERRIGHTGTLDPFATGVLVLLLGKATRLAQFLSGVDKEYEAIIRLGFATDTGDRTGQPLPPAFSQREQPSAGEINEAILSLIGPMDQVPPMYSAKKIAGKKLYELARRGEEVERQPVSICIHEFEAIKSEGELLKDNLDGTFDLKVRVVCTSGTYVRTLAEDFGKRLQLGAHLAELRRTRVGEFPISQSVTLEQVKESLAEEAIGTVLIPPAAALSTLPLMHLTSDDVRRTRQGMEVRSPENSWADGERVRMCGEAGELIAIGEYDATMGKVRPRIVLV
jgi:tRNA pseudouridine55 synthase